MSLICKRCSMALLAAVFLVSCQRGPADPSPSASSSARAASAPSTAEPPGATTPEAEAQTAAEAPAALKSTLTHGSKPATAPMDRSETAANPQQAMLLKQIGGSLREESAQAYHDRGVMYLLLGEDGVTEAYRLAVADFSKALKFDSSLIGAYNNRAMAYSRLGELERALEDFDGAIKLDPNNAGLSMRKASLLAKLGRDGEAIEVYSKAFELGDVDALFNRGNAYLRLGRNSLARRDFQTVIAKSKNPQVVEAAEGNLEAIAEP